MQTDKLPVYIQHTIEAYAIWKMLQLINTRVIYLNKSNIH